MPKGEKNEHTQIARLRFDTRKPIVPSLRAGAGAMKKVRHNAGV